jgi:RRXRR protein
VPGRRLFPQTTTPPPLCELPGTFGTTAPSYTTDWFKTRRAFSTPGSEGQDLRQARDRREPVLLKRRSATFPSRRKGAHYEAVTGLFGVPELAVFALDKRKKPLMSCCQKRARLPLTRGRAVAHRRHPYTIRLKDRIGARFGPSGSRSSRQQYHGRRDHHRRRRPQAGESTLSVRVAVRASGSFTIGNADGINAKYCKLLYSRGRLRLCRAARASSPGRSRGS